MFKILFTNIKEIGLYSLVTFIVITGGYNSIIVIDKYNNNFFHRYNKNIDILYAGVVGFIAGPIIALYTTYRIITK